MASIADKVGFTPSPWEAQIDPYEDDPFPGKDFVRVCMGQDDVSGITTPANARLIAAAPELFEACKRVLNHAACRVDGSTEEILRAALAKARGEA